MSRPAAPASWGKVLLINAAVLAGILVPLEVATRIIAPEYAHVHFSDTVTRGHDILRNHQWGHRVGHAQVDDPLGPVGGEYRVLFLGDSVTFGYGIEYEDAYHEVAGRLLKDAGCDAMLHGLGNYNSDLDKLLMSPYRPFIASGFRPDLAIYQFNVNDLDLPGPEVTPDERTQLLNRLQRLRITYLNRSAFLTAVQSFAMRVYQRSLKQRLRDSLRYSPATNPFAYRAQWQVMEESLVNARELFRGAGADFAILMIPESYRVSSDPLDNEIHMDLSGIREWPDETMRRLAERLGIPVIDATPALQAYRAAHPGERLYFPNDENHPTERGHEVVAGALARELAPMIPTCPRGPGP